MFEQWEKQHQWRETKDGKEFLASFPAYKTSEEFYEDLSKVKPVDYTKEDLAMEDAVAHSKEVLGILLKSRDLNLNQEKDNVSDALKSVGCVKWAQAHEKFTKGHERIGDLLYEENVGFPLSAYQQLVDSSSETFSFGLDRLLDGGVENSWVSSWLATQKMAECSQTQDITDIPQGPTDAPTE